MTEKTQDVAEHYTRGDLGAVILAALEDAGKDIDRLTQADLAPMDQFHFRGLEATRELAERAGIGAGEHVLDVGCGIGGPSRHLASEAGCRVTGLDLTEEFCRVAEMLAERTGLSGRVDYHQGDATAMPFEDASFDVVWTQHVAMNIADKEGLYAEMHRVLKPGGRFAVYDILAGNGAPLHFPVPWARVPEISFLMAPEALRARLDALGFEILAWEDVTAPGLEWRRALREKAKAEPGAGMPPPIGIHLIMGAEWPEMFANVGRNLEEGRIVLIQAVARKP